MITAPFNAPRRVPCRTCVEAYAQQASIEELLGGIAKVAMPIVTGLLSGAPGGATSGGAAPGGTTAATAGASAPSPPTAAQGEDLMRLLNMILGSIMGSGNGVSQPQSLLTGQSRDNRFAAAQSTEYSQAFIAPAMLAFLGPLIDGVVKVLPGVIGPIAQNAPQFLREFNQHLPMLINAINQREIAADAAEKKMATDMLADVNRTTLIEQFLRAQPPAPASGQGGDVAALGQLMQLLQQLAPPPAAAAAQPGTVAVAGVAAPPANVAAAQSLSRATSGAPSPSTRAVLTFSHASPLMWNGTERVLFARDRGLQFTLRLNVTAPVPRAPLPKAILELVFKDPADGSTLLEKSFRQKNWLPNSDMPFAFAPDELATVPVNRALKVIARLRWPTAAGSESSALGSLEFALVDKYFIKQQGAVASAERELKDMNRFRPFWNKVWEAPVIDEAGSRSERSRQVLWSLNVNARYAVLLSAEHEANGAMENRLLTEKVEAGDINARTNGRLKGGMELSIAELNKLMPLWDGAQPLDSDRLAAFKARPLVAGNAMDFIYNMKLSGKAGQRGMVWVVPVFKLFAFTLAAVRDVDQAGQVTGVDEEPVRFPLPVAARVIAVRSEH